MKLHPGQIISFKCSTDDNPEEYINFGTVVTKLKGLKTHYVVSTGLGTAYVSNTKVLHVYDKAVKGQLVYIINGSGEIEKYVIDNVALTKYAVILYCRCLLTNNLKTFNVNQVNFYD